MPLNPANYADLRIDPDWIVPVEPARAVLYRHSLLVRDGRIAALIPRELAEDWDCAEHVILPGHVLIPGLVNLHTHAAMTLLRGYADDLPLMTWLHDHIWPAEGRHMSPEFVRDGARIACAEMLEGGITCFNDMYFFPEAAVEAAVDSGIRITCGLIVVDFTTVYAGDADAYMQRGLAVRDQWRDHPLVRFTLAPHAPYSVSDRALEKVVTYAEQLDLPVHMHIHETEDEIRESLEKHGLRPLARLNNLGLLTPGLTAIHTVHLDEAEIALLAEHGCHIAHCPASNLKLASGFAPITQLLAAGVNVGLGTDGAASNNRLDLMGEMRLAALLAKGVSGNAAALPAYQALEMATLAGAKALGLGDEIGSISVGKSADLVAVDLSSPAHQPCYDPVSHLVYSAGRDEVRHVWVAGQQRVKNGQALQVDHERLASLAQSWGTSKNLPVPAPGKI